MSQGLQIWDAAGNLIMDVGTRTSRLIGIINPNLVDGSQSFTGSGNELIAIVSDFADSQEGTGGTGILPVVSVSGETVSWTFNGQPEWLRMHCRILVLGY